MIIVTAFGKQPRLDNRRMLAAEGVASSFPQLRYHRCGENRVPRESSVASGDTFRLSVGAATAFFSSLSRSPLSAKSSTTASWICVGTGELVCAVVALLYIRPGCYLCVCRPILKYLLLYLILREQTRRARTRTHTRGGCVILSLLFVLRARMASASSRGWNRRMKRG